MRIIVAGCGKVGYTIAEQLNKENHQITVIDENAEKLATICDALDVIGVCGNCASLSTLEKAGIANADMLVAVTGSDEQNLLCAVLAKQTGRVKTVARVRNPIYNGEIDFLRKQLGIGLIINPELYCAQEIARIFQFPSAVKIDTFSKGRLDLFHFKIAKNSELIDYKLINLRKDLGVDVVVCFVTRGDELIIPKGDFVFAENDRVSFIATPKEARVFFSKLNINVGKVKNVMIVGGGNISFYLAEKLLDAGINVKIIEPDKLRCFELSDLLPKATVICSDTTDSKVIVEEGIENVDGFAALTGFDEENVVLSVYAKKISQAKIVTNINRIHFESVLDDINLDTVTYPRYITSDVIIRYARSINASMDIDVENLYKFADGSAEALEFIIRENSRVTDIPLAQLKIKKNVLIGGIIRSNKLIIPKGSDELKVGDNIIVMMKEGRLNNIEEILEN